jgi:hypothetical protein
LIKIDSINEANQTNSDQSARTLIGYDFGLSFKELALSGLADVGIFSPEDGFSPLGNARTFLEDDLGISIDYELSKICWNSIDVTLLAIPSRRENSILKGIILAPGSNCDCYKKFVTSTYSKPSRDFYYNVTYEAISHACNEWGAKALGISHLCGSNKFHVDMANCHVEALVHFCHELPSLAPDSLLFCGCCISQQHLSEVNSIIHEANKTTHRSIDVYTEKSAGNTLITLNWTK